MRLGRQRSQTFFRLAPQVMLVFGQVQLELALRRRLSRGAAAVDGLQLHRRLRPRRRVRIVERANALAGAADRRRRALCMCGGVERRAVCTGCAQGLCASVSCCSWSSLLLIDMELCLVT